MRKPALLIYLILLSPNIVLSEAAEIYALNQLDEYRDYPSIPIWRGTNFVERDPSSDS